MKKKPIASSLMQVIRETAEGMLKAGIITVEEFNKIMGETEETINKAKKENKDG